MHSRQSVAFIFLSIFVIHPLSAMADLSEKSNAKQAAIQDKDIQLGFTPLIAASRDGDLTTVKSILKQGTDIEHKSKNGMTALAFAAIKGHSNIVKELLRAGANPKTTDNTGATPLNWSAYKGNAESCIALIKAGADVNAMADQKYAGYPPISSAASKGHLKIVRELIRAGADVNKKDQLNMRPLIWSLSSHGQSRRYLLEQGADVNVRNSAGLTALDIAEQSGFVSAANSLKGAGPRSVVNTGVVTKPLSAPSVSGKKGHVCSNTPKNELLCASLQGNTVLVAKLLAEGANINVRGPNGETALMVARDNIKPLLLKAGADPKALDDSGHNAIHYAVDNADHMSVGTLKSLISAGTDINQKTKKEAGGATPLMYATSQGANGYFDVIKYLVQSGADVNAKDANGNTALMYAVSGHDDCVKALIDAGANVNARIGQNNDGESAIEMAKKSGDMYTVEILQKHVTTK